MNKRLAALAAATFALAAFPALAGAHPDEKGEVYIPWTSFVGQERAQELTQATAGAEAAADAQAAQAGTTQDLRLVGNSDKDGTTNSDLAFNGNLVYAGHYGGFRILDTRGNQPRVVVDKACRGPQNDVSFHKMGGKTFLSSRSTRVRPARTAPRRTHRSSEAPASATRAFACSTSPILPSLSSST